VVADGDKGACRRTAAVTVVRRGKINSQSDDVRGAYTLDVRAWGSRARETTARDSKAPKSSATKTTAITAISRMTTPTTFGVGRRGCSRGVSFDVTREQQRERRETIDRTRAARHAGQPFVVDRARPFCWNPSPVLCGPPRCSLTRLSKRRDFAEILALTSHRYSHLFHGAAMTRTGLCDDKIYRVKTGRPRLSANSSESLLRSDWPPRGGVCAFPAPILALKL